jgi:hypothetical protein
VTGTSATRTGMSLNRLMSKIKCGKFLTVDNIKIHRILSLFQFFISQLYSSSLSGRAGAPLYQFFQNRLR